MARVLIAGCGYLGEALGLYLIQEGHSVCGLRRSRDCLPSQFVPLYADLNRPETLTNWPWPFDIVFYVAGAESRTEAAYQSTYVNGLANLIEALQDQDPPVHRFFFTSSTAVYAQSGGEWVDENSPVSTSHFAGRCLREGERLLLKSLMMTTVLRVGGIYGPGRNGLIQRVQRGDVCCVKGPPRYLNHIHRDDCVRALAHLMKLKSPLDLYLVVDKEPPEKCQLIRWIAERLGVASPSWRLPDICSTKRGNKRCRNSQLVASGYDFLYPSFREGYVPLLSE